MLATADSPGIEDSLRQRPKLFQRVHPQAVEKFGARDVSGFAAAARVLLSYFLHRMIESKPHKIVCLAIKSCVLLADEGDDAWEVRILHGYAKLACALRLRNIAFQMHPICAKDGKLQKNRF
jgi:hypothetical protein